MRPNGGTTLLKLVARGHRSRFWAALSPLLAIVMTIVVTGLLFLAFGKPPLHALDVFLVQPLTSTNGLAELCVKAAPLIMIGVGIALAARANVWNIGAEGQFIMGAIFGGGLALALPDWPAWALFPLMALAGIIGGMLYGGIVALLRVQFNANEILTSLMLNYVAQYVLIYLVSGPWRDPTGYGFPQTAMFSSTAAAPILVDGTRLHLGVAVALAVGSSAGWFCPTRSTVFRFAYKARRRARRASQASATRRSFGSPCW